MTKKLRFLIPLLLIPALAASAFADTVTLKNGERIEATIASETATEMTLDIQISAGITDQRVVKKADVAKVDRVAPDEAAYRAIMNLQPGKNSLLAAQYGPIVQAIEAFTLQHSDSSHLKDAQTVLKAFQAERTRVEAGEIKFDGLWLSKTEAQKQRVQIGGMLAFNTMKTANAAGDPIGALNAFSALEKNFPGAKVMPDAIELARQIITALKPATERAIATEKVLKMDREKGFAAAGPQDRAEMMAAHQRDLAKADAALTTATTANLWPPFLPTSEKCLTAILAKAVPEAARLEKIPVAPMRESVKLAEKAQTEFTAKDYAAAAETLKDVTKLWPANEMALRITAQIADAKNPPKPDPATSVALVPGTPATAGTATPAPQAGAATPAPATATAPAATVTTPAAPEEEEKPAEEPAKPFFMTLGGAITIVLLLAVVLGALNVFNKVRSRANETLE